jgi:hypothetical protein
MATIVAAGVFAAFLTLLLSFQLALAAGAPWGVLAMGGRFPGRFPPAMRIAALLQIAVYGLLGAIVLVRAGLILPEWLDVSRIAIWAVVCVMGVAVVLNVITPSKWERRLWAPVAFVMLAATLRVAVS